MEGAEDIELLPCSFQFHNFQHEVGEVRFECQIMKMERSLYLWIGDCNERTMSDLAVAFVMDGDSRKSALSTKIMGQIVDETSTNIASRLSMKLGQPVYVSFNLKLSNQVLPSIERRIHDEFKNRPEIFAS